MVRAERIELQMKAPVAAVTAVGLRVSAAGGLRPSPALQRRLSTALAGLRASQRGLAALPAPRSAQKLRSTALRLDDEQIMLTRELSQMIGYPARFQAAIRPLHGAVQTLSAALAQRAGPSVATIYSARAAALEAFTKVVDRIAARLRSLTVPSVFLPGYRAELSALTRMGSAAAGLAGAMRRGGAGGAAPLRSLQRAFLLGTSGAVRRSEIAAVRAYDLQLQDLTTLAARLQQERLQLSASVS